MTTCKAFWFECMGHEFLQNFGVPWISAVCDNFHTFELLHAFILIWMAFLTICAMWNDLEWGCFCCSCRSLAAPANWRVFDVRLPISIGGPVTISQIRCFNILTPQIHCICPAQSSQKSPVHESTRSLDRYFLHVVHSKSIVSSNPPVL